MVYNARAPGEKFQLATEVVFKTVLVTEKKYSAEVVGGHEPEGPETKRFKVTWRYLFSTPSVPFGAADFSAYGSCRPPDGDAGCRMWG